MVLIPLSYVIIGPLADNVFEPFAQGPAWDAFAPLWGTGPGAGMGLLISLCGAAVCAISYAIYSLPMVRNLETLLPDYAVQSS
jgi:hypothetical protein